MGTHFKGKPQEVRALDAYVKLSRAASSIQARLDRGLREIGLTESQLGVLEMLLHLGPMHQHRIGRKLLLSRANVTLLVDQLARRRLVRRERDRQDRRCITVHLSAEGRRRITRVFPGHVQSIVEAFSALTAREQQTLGHFCRTLGRSNQAALQPER